MPLEHVVTYQAFREITNFIRDNGDDWEDFCTNTKHPSTTRKAVKPPSPRSVTSKHKTSEIEGRLAPEPLLQPNPHRFVIFPIQHNDIWQMNKKAEASFWTAEEIDLTDDVTDWAGLSPTKQHFICHILAFFAASDGIVNENLCNNFATEVTSAEACCIYGLQIAVKNIHSKTYSLLIDTYIKDPAKKMHVLRAIETVPCIQKKARWGFGCWFYLQPNYKGYHTCYRRYMASLGYSYIVDTMAMGAFNIRTEDGSDVNTEHR